ncbi:hypothetical protein [Brevibacterium otitidis]|uniref:Uncharacterized protein n=1 Tax=Brevibacterium otitidis TaxID=53364 RepID=A0ABV5X355_9MICO|nr:hypothetical protein GCM10023233_30270 [Brevibacterium otitidis]
MVLVWSVLGSAGGIVTVIYLGLRVAMTHTLEEVFGRGHGFNWFVL